MRRYLILLFSGWTITSVVSLLAVAFSLLENGRNLFRQEAGLRSRHLSAMLLGSDIIGVVRAMGLINIRVKDAVTGEADPKSNRLLDSLEAIRRGCRADLVYIMNGKGDVVASTTFGEGENLMGNNYAFRDYFRNAIQGSEAVQIAMGVTTSRRGVYYAAPIYRELPNERPIGVAVVKMGFDRIDQFIGEVPFPTAFLSREDVVFAANVPAWLFQEGVVAGLDHPGPGTVRPAAAWPQLQLVRLGGRLHALSREEIVLDKNAGGWQILSLAPIRPWLSWPPLLATVAANFIFWGLVGMLLHNHRLQGRLAEEHRLSTANAAATYQAVFNASRDAIFIHEIGTGRVVDINQGFTEIFGYSREEGLELGLDSLSEGIPPYSMANALEKIKAAESGEDQIFDWHARHRKGNLFWIEVHLHRANINGIDRVMATARDITERKQNEEDLQRYNRDLEIAAKLKKPGENPVGE